MRWRRSATGLVALTATMVVVTAQSASSVSGSGVTSRVSVAPGGRQGNANSQSFGAPAISADGRFVAFVSDASHLVPGDTNGSGDVFVRDWLAGVTWRVSVGAGGQANDSRFTSAISADGRFVAFDSFASDLVAGDTNATGDVFVRDRLAGVTRRVSVVPAGRPTAIVSARPSPPTGVRSRTRRSRRTWYVGTGTGRRTCSSAIRCSARRPSGRDRRPFGALSAAGRAC